MYDYKKKKKIFITKGLPTKNSDIAIYLIYSPGGLQESHFRTISHLNFKGFSPIVVVNHKLNEKDHDRLKKYSWIIIQRPNIGYDFGGYREAALHLIESKITPNMLLFLNDSIWFPLFENEKLISEAREANCDLYGFSKDHHKRSNKPAFIQSFFFAFKGDILHSKSYINFWTRMYMINNKWAVIRLLEMRLSPYFEYYGFKTDCLFSYEKIGENLEKLNRASQIAYLNSPEALLGDDSYNISQRICNGEKLSREEWNEIAARGRLNSYIFSQSPEILFDVFRVPVLKKLRQTNFKNQREIIVKRGYHRMFYDEIAKEVERWDKL